MRKQLSPINRFIKSCQSVCGISKQPDWVYANITHSARLLMLPFHAGIISQCFSVCVYVLPPSRPLLAYFLITPTGIYITIIITCLIIVSVREDVPWEWTKCLINILFPVSFSQNSVFWFLSCQGNKLNCIQSGSVMHFSHIYYSDSHFSVSRL